MLDLKYFSAYRSLYCGLTVYFVLRLDRVRVVVFFFALDLLCTFRQVVINRTGNKEKINPQIFAVTGSISVLMTHVPNKIVRELPHIHLFCPAG